MHVRVNLLAVVRADDRTAQEGYNTRCRGRSACFLRVNLPNPSSEPRCAIIGMSPRAPVYVFDTGNSIQMCSLRSSYTRSTTTSKCNVHTLIEHSSFA